MIGYLCCLGFVMFAVTSFGFFPDVLRAIHTHAATMFDAFRSDRNLGPAIRYTVRVFGVTFSPSSALGLVFAAADSPVGVFSLLFYILIAWMLPAR